MFVLQSKQPVWVRHFQWDDWWPLSVVQNRMNATSNRTALLYRSSVSNSSSSSQSSHSASSVTG